MNALLAWVAASGGLIFGMWLLTRSADWFVEGSVGLACRLRIPPLIIGFTIVGFGTSAPETLVSVLAAAQGMTALSLGNAYGSNITNVLLILGVSMLVAPVALHRVALRRDIPFLVLVVTLTAALAVRGSLTRADAVLMLVLFAAFLAWQIGLACARRAPQVCDAANLMPLKRALGLTFGGLGALLLASQILVWAARFVAEHAAAAAGISPEATQLIVGVTVVALGTSLPELMASVSAMRQGQHDIALGNVVGSNCFNICVVAGLALLIRPIREGEMLNALRFRDVFVMLGSTLLLWGAGLWAWLRVHGQKRAITLGRAWSIPFLVLWVAYTLWVVLGTRS